MTEKEEKFEFVPIAKVPKRESEASKQYRAILEKFIAQPIDKTELQWRGDVTLETLAVNLRSSLTDELKKQVKIHVASIKVGNRRKVEHIYLEKVHAEPAKKGRKQ